MKRFLTIATLICAAIVGSAQVDLQTYYATTSGLNKGALKTALCEIIKNPKVVGYDNLWQYFPTTDRRADGKVWDMYSNNTYEFNDDGSTVTGMDREHAFPKSWWASGVSADKYGCYSDLFNLNPADATANQQAKNNLPMGEVDESQKILYDNGVVRSGYNADGYRVWEPADEYKGDFARAYMYVVTCYEEICTAGNDGGPTWSSDAMRQILWKEKTTYPIFTDYSIELLLRWHAADPVSDKELNRNEAIYRIQGNRNPFIDCPKFADYIWGEKMSESFDLEELTGKCFFTMPRHGEQYAFKGDTIEATQSLRMQFKASNVTQPISWHIEGATKGTFTLPSAQLSVSDLTKGKAQTITYTSSVPANDTAQIVLESSEMSAPVSITLTAEARDIFQPLEPEIDDEAVTIRWRPSADAMGYKITLFQMRNLGEKAWVETLNEDFASWPTTWTRSTNGMSWKSQNGGLINLGSASNGGFAATPTLALGDSVRIMLHAAFANAKDASPRLHISLDGAADTAQIVEIALTQDTALYAATIANTVGNGSVRCWVEKSNRAVMTDLKIESFEAVESRYIIADTLATGNRCKIENLTLGEKYLYIIQPVGGEFPTIFGPFEVTTGKTYIEKTLQDEIFWKISGENLVVENLPTDATITLYDAAGRTLATAISSGSMMNFVLKNAGVYILQIDNSAIKILK